MKKRPRSQLNISSKNFIKEKRVYFIIAVIVLFYLINNFIWLKQNTYPSGPDEAVHLTISLKYFKAISSNIRDILPSYPTKISAYWPPLFYISSAVLNLLSGTSHISSVMINILYLIILLFSVYLVGLKLFDRNTGISAMIFISMYPIVFRYSRFFVSDLALTAMVCLSICLLLYTEHFKKRKFSILFGFSVGLGMLIKWTFILFLIGPLTYTLFQMLLLKIKQATYIKQQVLNFIRSLVIGILISSSWYLSAFSTVIRRIKDFVWGTASYDYTPVDLGLGVRAVFQLDKFFKQLLLLINEQISLLFFIAFLIAIFIYFLRRKNKLVLILWFALPYFVLSLSFHKEGRYMLPSLPALALISGAGFQSIVSKKWRYFLYSTVMLLGLVQFFDISYNLYRKDRTFPFGTPIGPVHILCCPKTEHRSWSYGPPFKKDFKIERIANPIAKHYKYIPDSSSPVIGIICEPMPEDNYTSAIFRQPDILNYYLAKEDNRVDFLIFKPLPNVYILDFVSKLNEIDCIVFISKNNTWPKFDDLKKTFNECLSVQKCRQEFLKSMGLGKRPTVNIDTFFIEDANKRLREFLSNKDKEFHLIKEIKLLDGYSAYIYAKENYLLKDGLLSLTFFNDRSFLWYDDKKLTPRGIETSLIYKDREYHSYQANWRVKRLSNNILEARGEWEDLPGLIQVWQFELMNNQDIRCEVNLKTEKPGDIKDLEMAKIWLSIDGDYKHWLSAYKEGNFRGRGGIILKDANTKFIGVFNNIKDDNVPPGVFFVLAELPAYSLAQIQYSTNERQLVYWANLNKNNLHVKKQVYPLFRTYIKVAQSGTELKELIEDQRKKEIQRRSNLETKYSLNKDNVKIFLDFGQGRIYWKDKEITDGFGFYTSILAQGNWHDSQNVLWEIEKKDDSTLLARGRWIKLPLSQIWQVKLKDDGLIEWNIGLEVYEKIKLKEVQANIILTRDYRCANSEILEAVSQNNSLPHHIKFILKDNHSICHRRAIGKAHFLNSKAIVLKYYDILNEYTQPGRYENYFKGEISID